MIQRRELAGLFVVLIVLGAVAVAGAGIGTQPSAARAMVSAATVASLAVPASASGATLTESTQANSAIVNAANAFLDSLDTTQKSKAVFAFSNTTAKAQWSNLPAGLFTWSGVRMGDLSSSQQQLVRNLLTVTLSTKGYDRVMASVQADEVLKSSQGGSNTQQLGAENYFVAIFGTPSTTSPWMFRFGGHHITVNATIVGVNLALTPSFPGCQPCTYTQNGATVQLSAEQASRAFTFIQSLTTTQVSQMVRGSTAIDLVLGPSQAMRTVPTEWLQASTLTTA